MSKKDEKESLFCSFCGKSQKEVKKLIAGPTVFVCDECVELCMDIIKEDSKNNNVYDYNWNSFNDADFRRRFIIKTIVVVYVESVLLNAFECHLHVL